MNLQCGLDQLKQQARDTEWFSELLVLEARLSDNLVSERLYGVNENLRSDRARVIGQLNNLALQYLGVDFNSLCRSEVASASIHRGDTSPALPLHSPTMQITSAVGALRITLTQDQRGCGLSTQNIGERELMLITITLRPPPSVMINQTVFEIARLPVGRTSMTLAFNMKPPISESSSLSFKISYRPVGAPSYERFDGIFAIPANG